MKRKIPALFAALLLTLTFAGCQQSEESPSSSDPSSAPASESEPASASESSEPSEPSEPEKTYTPILSQDDYPTVDGSTANIPLMALVMERAAGVERRSPKAPPPPAPPPSPGATSQTAAPTSSSPMRPPIRSRRSWPKAPSWRFPPSAGTRWSLLSTNKTPSSP